MELFINEEIKGFIRDNELVNIQQSPASELYDLWKDRDGCIWDYEKIKNAFEESRHKQTQEAMADA
jgi:hypothetical protein